MWRTNLAAVGATSALVSLLINIPIGFSVNVMVGKYCGAKRENNIEETVHTVVLIAVSSE